jgi:hypothetical protein
VKTALIILGVIILVVNPWTLGASHGFFAAWKRSRRWKKQIQAHLGKYPDSEMSDNFCDVHRNFRRVRIRSTGIELCLECIDEAEEKFEKP